VKYDVKARETVVDAVKRIKKDMEQHLYAVADIMFNGVSIQFYHDSKPEDIATIYVLKLKIIVLERELNNGR
jgi:hypothetical protein